MPDFDVRIGPLAGTDRIEKVFHVSPERIGSGFDQLAVECGILAIVFQLSALCLQLSAILPAEHQDRRVGVEIRIRFRSDHDAGARIEVSRAVDRRSLVGQKVLNIRN